MRALPAAPATYSSAERGFTLIEVIVAMAITIVSLFGLLQLAGLSSSSNLKNQMRDEAVLVGEEQMKAMNRLPQASLPAFQALSSESRIRGSAKKYLVTREAQRVGTTDSYQFIVKVKWAYKNATSSHEVRSMRSYRDGR